MVYRILNTLACVLLFFVLILLCITPRAEKKEIDPELQQILETIQKADTIVIHRPPNRTFLEQQDDLKELQDTNSLYSWVTLCMNSYKGFRRTLTYKERKVLYELFADLYKQPEKKRFHSENSEKESSSNGFLCSITFIEDEKQILRFGYYSSNEFVTKDSSVWVSEYPFIVEETMKKFNIYPRKWVSRHKLTVTEFLYNMYPVKLFCPSCKD